MYGQLLTSKNTRFLLFITLLLYSFSALALKTDVEKPVNVEADSVVFNKQKGRAVYKGNVIIKQGTINIKAARIEIIAPDSEIKTILATGSPVRFSQTLDDGKQARGKARRVRYNVKNKSIVLTGNAELSQGADHFSSNYIEYLTATGELKAGGKSKKSRVRAIFYPTNKAQ